MAVGVHVYLLMPIVATAEKLISWNIARGLMLSYCFKTEGWILTNTPCRERERGGGRNVRRWNWITLRAASCRGAVIVLKGAYSMHEALCKYSRPVSGCAVFCMFIRGGDGLRMREFNIHMHILSTGKTWFEVDRQLTVSVPPCTHLDITHIQKLTSIFPLCLSMSFSDLFFFFWHCFCFLNYSRLVVGLSFQSESFFINFGGYFLLSLASACWKSGIFSSANLVSNTKKAITAFQPLQMINKPKIPSFGSFRCVVYECGWYVLPFLFNVNLIC